jgi:UDP-GlcNAc:undecaprenyl-phosphate/decaprenyl-phosphate GlcNAc-1-phosphate transferase
VELYLAVIAGCAVASAALVPVVKRIANAVGAVDQPVGGRRVHSRPIPRLGGVAIFVPVLLALELGLSFLPEGGPRLTLSGRMGLLIAFACIFLLGLYDDIRAVNPWMKLGVQAIAAGTIIASGVTILDVATPFGFSVPLGVFGFPFTLLWILGVTNGINLLDGIDGLAAGISAMGALTILIISLGRGDLEIALIAAALLGSLLGFLVFNFPPASIFLGDCGALFLGFTLATLPIIGGQKKATAVALLVPIIALGVPIFDTTLAIVRRTTRGRHPFDPDRGHLHHRLLALGLSQRQVTLGLYAVSAMLTAMAVLMTNASQAGALVILLWLGGTAVLVVRRLGADEVHVLWEMLRHGERRRRPPRARALLVRNSVPLLERCENAKTLRSLLDRMRADLGFEVLLVRLKRDVTPAAMNGISEYALIDPDLPPERSLVPVVDDAAWSGKAEIFCGTRKEERQGGGCRFKPTCRFQNAECELRGVRSIGEVWATKPLWRTRRASENDEELLQVIAEALGRWVTTHSSSASTARPKVLVADDDRGMRKIIADVLEGTYDVITAADGFEAIAEARAKLPDLILLDLKMPRIDGYAACRTLRADPRTHGTPIIILTGLGDLTDKLKGMGMGADDYITKPFDVEDLLARVQMVLRRASVR